MKKLIFAAAAVAGMGAFALESANIVGFQGADVPKGYYNIQGVMFQDVSGTTIDLQNVKMGDNDLLDASTTLRTWSGSAWVDFVYGELVDADWNNITDADGNKVIGWGQDPDGMMAAFQLSEPKALRRGEAFLITASGGTAGDAAMKVSGEVWNAGSDVQWVGYEVPKGSFNLCCNPFPGAEMDLQNIKMGENDLLDASTTLRTWDGTAWVDYVYGELVDADWNNITDAEGNKVIGWGQDPDGMMAAFQLAEPKILRPGEGFLATASGGTTGSAQMLFKNPFYVAE